MLLSRAKCQPLFENVNFDSAAWELIADLNHIDQISAGRKTNKNMVEKKSEIRPSDLTLTFYATSSNITHTITTTTSTTTGMPNTHIFIFYNFFKRAIFFFVNTVNLNFLINFKLNSKLNCHNDYITRY